ncbi:MAG: hypothetical protein ACK5Z1_07120, partial [Gemmatimonadota bacterium]
QTPSRSTTAPGASPSRRTRQEWWSTNPSRMAIWVLLQAPFGPAMPTTSPGATDSVTSATAWTSRPRQAR